MVNPKRHNSSRRAWRRATTLAAVVASACSGGCSIGQIGIGGGSPGISQQGAPAMKEVTPPANPVVQALSDFARALLWRPK